MAHFSKAISFRWEVFEPTHPEPALNDTVMPSFSSVMQQVIGKNLNKNLDTHFLGLFFGGKSWTPTFYDNFINTFFVTFSWHFP